MNRTLIGSSVYHVLGVWGVCTKKLKGVLSAFKCYILNNNSTVMHKVIKTFEHMYGPQSQQTIFLFTYSTINGAP